MRASAGERAVVVVGVLPLLAAGFWLLLLREPTPAVAERSAPRVVMAPERSGTALGPSFVGVVVAGQDAELGAEVGGEVVRVFHEPGAHVKRGEPLLQLAALSVLDADKLASAQALEDRSAIVAAELTLQSARDQLERMSQAEAAYSARDLRKARTEVAHAAADFARMKASAAVHRATHGRELARADKQLVRAPFDGVLSARYLDTGDFAAAGQTLARVVDQSRFVRFAVPAEHHQRLQQGASVQLVLAQSGLPLTVRVVDVDPELDAAAGVGFARAQLSAAQVDEHRPMPGTRVEVRLLSEGLKP